MVGVCLFVTHHRDPHSVRRSGSSTADLGDLSRRARLPAVQGQQGDSRRLTAVPAGHRPNPARAAQLGALATRVSAVSSGPRPQRSDRPTARARRARPAPRAGVGMVDDGDDDPAPSLRVDHVAGERRTPSSEPVLSKRLAGRHRPSGSGSATVPSMAATASELANSSRTALASAAASSCARPPAVDPLAARQVPNRSRAPVRASAILRSFRQSLHHVGSERRGSRRRMPRSRQREEDLLRHHVVRQLVDVAHDVVQRRRLERGERRRAARRTRLLQPAVELAARFAEIGR